jgi:SAM-dependent methyltransferase
MHGDEAPSQWVQRFARLIRPGGRVLDLACGRGRHTRLLRESGHFVIALDRDQSALLPLRGDAVQPLCADVEALGWPFAPGAFDAVVVTNYLHRPLFPGLVEALAPGGALIYETFAAGNERYGRPSNPAFLLQRNELLERVSPLEIVAFEQGRVAAPPPAVVQRICAVRADASGPQSTLVAALEAFSLG